MRTNMGYLRKRTKYLDVRCFNAEALLDKHFSEFHEPELLKSWCILKRS